MNKTLFGILALCSLMTAAAQADETSMAHGKQLHEQSCTSCHAKMTGGDGSALYIRSNRRVNSLPELNAQVRRCESNLELKWFDEDINSVTEYLNTNYYKF